MLNQLPLLKFGAQIAAGMGVSKIVSDIVRNNVPVITTAQAVCVKAGTFVLGSMLVEQSSNHIETQVNNLVELAEKFRKKSDSEEE